MERNSCALDLLLEVLSRLLILSLQAEKAHVAHAVHKEQISENALVARTERRYGSFA